ncbi:XrtN system VIT domain-containing protein [Niabella sp. CJ426]|uniref:XrtN system VIT domain-containing protein n=1 Tax=Niabella sp. CJ426 TaxID=3393740 RepID=UPI003D03006D
MKSSLRQLNALSLLGIGISLVLAIIYTKGFYQREGIVSESMGIFFAGYFVTIIYIIVNFLSGERGTDPYRNNVVIALSCLMWCGFILNRDMRLVPEISGFSLATLTMLFVVGIAVQSSIKYNWVIKLLYFMYGIAMFMLLLFVIYFVVLMPMGLIGMVALGMGGLVFLPLICFCYFGSRIARDLKDRREMIYPFFSGFGAVIVFVIIKIILLTTAVNKVERSLALTHYNHKADLPEWITVTKNLELNGTLEDIILYNLSTPFFQDLASEDLFRFNTGSNRAFEFKHNPIAELAYVFVPRLSLTEDEMLSVLGFYYNHNYIKEKRLWDGESVKTNKLWSEVMLYPGYHLAYTETIFNITNTGFGNGEAIYTISMPPHSIVTSLSLWINGVEEKAVLTSKEKAEKAYNNIVGVQQRDPSLVQWREGNKVSLRVFPVTKEMPRKVKIGITSPLELNGKELAYTPIKIIGQDIQNAERMVKVQTIDDSAIPDNGILKKDENGWWVRPEFASDFRLTIPVKPLSSNTFNWKGREYTAMPYKKLHDKKAFATLVLDVNKAWSQEEWNTIMAINGPDKKVYFNNEWKTVAPANRDELFDELHRQNFSFIPVASLDSTTLVVTKSTSVSPNFEDLLDTDYGRIITSKMNQGQRCAVYHLSAFTNDFWNTLNERKWILSDYGTTRELKALLEEGVFIKDNIIDNSIDIPFAGLSIRELPADSKGATGNGTNHLYRMYAYNKLMGNYHFKDSSEALINKGYLELAKDANIVSPISSLVVLETQADYKNNAIDVKNNGLGNANMKNHGAVPEPHEWALIIIGAAGLLYYVYKRKKHAWAFKA